MSEIVKVTNEKIQTISSREVAEMMEMNHKDLLRKIDGINEDFESAKLRHQKYWIESSFENRGKQYREFQVTKRGCEFLAHKSTGTKGNLFTDKYMDRFEQMENQINQQKSLSPLDQLRLQYQVLESHEERFEKIEERLNSLEINPHQKRAIQRAKSKRVLQLLGGRKSKAYKNASLRGKVYADMGRQYNNYFDISEYAYTPRNKFEEALELINSYNLSIELSMEVKQLNQELAFA